MAAELEILLIHGPRLRAGIDIEHSSRPDLLIVTGDLAEGGLPGEFRQATQSLARLAESLGIPRRHVAIVPGGHDVNKMACQAHFLLQGSRGEAPVPPYFPKWQQYLDAFTEFYAGVPGVTFTPDEPWTLFEMPDLRVVVAGLNSTMALSHQPDDYGLLTNEQLVWFANQLARYPDWLRIAALNHASPHDAAALHQVLIAPGLVNLRLDAEQATTDGNELITAQIPAPAEVIAPRDAYVAHRDINIYNGREIEQGRSESFLGRVAEVAKLRFPDSFITERTLSTSSYLRVAVTPEDGVAEVHPVGVIDGPASQEALDTFITDVHSRFSAADQGVRSELIYAGSPAPAELVLHARQRGVRLRSFIDYQGLLDLRPLAQRQGQMLAADHLYPPELYVDQRFTMASRPGAPVPEVRSGLLVQATDWLSTEAARLVVVLGDFGRGKTSFLRQLTRHLPVQLPALTPVLVELRYLEKGPTLDDLLAQHLIREGVDDVGKDKLRYMIKSGRVALLFDGFDELELRVGFDSAADYLQTLLISLTGQAKVVLTSRTQHFRSVSQVHAAVRTALGERVETQAGARVAILEDFTESQILEFLTNLYRGDAVRAQQRFELIGHIAGLLELTRNPRMLAFVAELPDERLLAVQSSGGSLTAGGLYAEIIDYWLANEEQRQRHSRGLAALTKDERFGVCTNLALHMWRTNEAKISLRDLTAEVVATLTRLEERGFSDDQAAHSIASGSLLVRPADDAFTFVHQSVMEWLVAAHAARELRDYGTTPVLRAREMSRLMAAFFTELAGHEPAVDWASKVLTDRDAPEAARRNALAVNARLPKLPEPERQDLSGLDLRGTELNGRDLGGASLRGANLRGMRLAEVSLERADLGEADFTGVVLTGGSLRGALLTGSRWDRAALLGTAVDRYPRGLAAAAITSRDRPEEILEVPSSPSFCVAFSPDGALVAYGADCMLKIADAATGRTLRVIQGHQRQVTGIAFSQDGTHIATASYDGTARIWNAVTGQAITTLTGHTGPVYAIAYSPDGAHIATATHRTTRIWNAITGQPIRMLTGHSDWVRAVAYSPDGTRIATASYDGTARTWNATTGQPITTITGHDSPVWAIAYSPDGTSIATATYSGTARIWNASNGQLITTIAAHHGWVRAIAYSPDGTSIATASGDGTARTWHAATGQAITTLTGHTGPVYAIAYSPDGTSIATASDDRTARIWNVTTGQAVSIFTGHNNGVRAVAYSPDGTSIATASYDGTARIWDATTGKPITVLVSQNTPAWAIAYSPDGTRVATASDDRIARIWDTITGQLIATLTGHTGPVFAVAYSPDGTHIATASYDGTARTWNATTGKPTTALTGHRGWVRAVAYSPDGTRIATASDDRTARIWDTITGQLIATLTGHAGYVTAIAYSRDGTHIATASDDRTARIWNVADVPSSATSGMRRLLRRRSPTPPVTTITTSITLRGHGGPVNAVAFHPSGARILTASTDGTLRVWRLTSSTAKRVILTGHDGAVNGIALHRDGRFFATASSDGTIKIWAMGSLLPMATLIALPEDGFAALLREGSYKIEGDGDARLWWAMKLCRFGPGELDPYVPEITRLPADAPILPEA